jgi:hypothetical protein
MSGSFVHNEKLKGSNMKRSILAALLGFAVFSATVKASVVDQVVVTIPFEFVAVDKTLPAGTYRVDRAFEDRTSALVLKNTDNRQSAIFVIPNNVEGIRAGKVYLAFEQIGDQHFLSKVESPNHLFNIKVPHAAALLASNPSRTEIVSGSGGSN